ncbi:MAG: M23 family metallopeptidase [Nitrospira sp.]|nr:M23 family metallopeptidase [bacterium]MBL7048452.1 M23 family metallopeptidase [Nitrospira sp.]
MNRYTQKNTNGFSRIALTVTLPFIILIAGYIVYKLFFIPDPVLSGTEALTLLPLDKTISLSGENLESVEISIYQDGIIKELLKDSPESSEKIYELHVKPRELQLKDGDAIIVIKLKSGLLKKQRIEIKTEIDTTPPDLMIMSSPRVIAQGGTGFAVLQASGAETVYIKNGEEEYKAFPKITDSDLDTSMSKSKLIEYFAFFPVPINTAPGTVFYVLARDEAGNQRVRTISPRIKEKRFKDSSITISDNFIDTVVTPLLNKINITNPAESFRHVNEDLRKESLQKIKEISENTADRMLWQGRFLQMKNSKVMAKYGDHRTYMYQNKPVSSSFHLGYDLASHAYAPVEAANSGIVRFADNLSIYGNTVIIDHGIGLMSIYGHLSTILVVEGQAVEKGDIIAKSGATGLAGGDHLHYGILVHGQEVSPLYWWDAKWIGIHITDAIQQ